MAIAQGRAVPTNGDLLLGNGSTLIRPEPPLRPVRSAQGQPFLRGSHFRWSDRLINLVMRTRHFAGGGTGNSLSATLVHLSPSSINITGISSTMGYLRPQSLQINHASLCSL